MIRNFLKKGPFLGWQVPTSYGTYVVNFETPNIVHFVFAVLVTLNILVWPVVGLIVAYRIVF